MKINRSTKSPDDAIRVNVTTKVNSKSIRRETHNGREHWIVPSYTLPFNVVMNGILYPKDQILEHFKGLENTLAPLGHPMVDGVPVSAFSPHGINANHVGASNQNVKLAGNRVYVEKFIDIEVAQRTEGGRDLLERLEALERGEDVPPIHTSVGLFLTETDIRENGQQDRGYRSIAKIHAIDHDAILLNEPGAATPAEGVGMMINASADSAVPLTDNADALPGESMRNLENRLWAAIKERYAPQYAWIEDFSESHAIIGTESGKTVRVAYQNDGTNVVLGSEEMEVKRETTWTEKNPVFNFMKKIFNRRGASSDILKGGQDMPMTDEERAALVKDTTDAITANLNQALAPLTERITALETNQQTITDAVTANSRQAEADMRATVAGKFGDVVANSLSGEALKEMHRKCADAATVNAAGNPPEARTTGKPTNLSHLAGGEQ